jgi:hypothetical protein
VTLDKKVAADLTGCATLLSSGRHGNLKVNLPARQAGFLFGAGSPAVSVEK